MCKRKYENPFYCYFDRKYKNAFDNSDNFDYMLYLLGLRTSLYRIYSF